MTLYDITSQKSVASFPHETPIIDIQFCENGYTVAMTTSAALLMYDLRKLTCTSTIAFTNPQVCFDSTGKYICVASKSQIEYPCFNRSVFGVKKMLKCAEYTLPIEIGNVAFVGEASSIVACALNGREVYVVGPTTEAADSTE